MNFSTLWCQGNVPREQLDNNWSRSDILKSVPECRFFCYSLSHIIPLNHMTLILKIHVTNFELPLKIVTN
jgi:hypothetical protein